MSHCALNLRSASLLSHRNRLTDILIQWIECTIILPLRNTKCANSIREALRIPRAIMTVMVDAVEKMNSFWDRLHVGEMVYLSRVRMEEGILKASRDWTATPASLTTPHQCFVGLLLCTPDGLSPEGTRDGEERIWSACRVCDLKLWEGFECSMYRGV